MKSNFNILIYLGIFIVLLLLFFLNGMVYEEMMKGTLNFGSIMKEIIGGLANLFHFPANIFISPTSDLPFLFLLFINLNFYTILIFCIRKVVLRITSI